VVTSTIVFEGDGRLEEYVGGYDDWLRQRDTTTEQVKSTAPKEQKQKREKTPKKKGKLSFKETHELESLPPIIEALEEEKKRLLETLNSSEFYASRDLGKINAANDRLGAVEKELDETYHRWHDLETLAEKFRGNPE
jgi:ABC transport system ATP-binding/permease protein